MGFVGYRYSSLTVYTLLESMKSVVKIKYFIIILGAFVPTIYYIGYENIYSIGL